MVGFKIAAVWLLAMLVSSSITVLGKIRFFHVFLTITIREEKRVVRSFVGKTMIEVDWKRDRYTRCDAKVRVFGKE